jgi:hypothetical protein
MADSRTSAAGDRDRYQRLAVQRLQARQDLWDVPEDDDTPCRARHRRSRTRAARIRRQR